MRVKNTAGCKPLRCFALLLKGRKLNRKVDHYQMQTFSGFATAIQNVYTFYENNCPGDRMRMESL